MTSYCDPQLESHFSVYPYYATRKIDPHLFILLPRLFKIAPKNGHEYVSAILTSLFKMFTAF
jgi:hypothetical protein